VGQYQVYHQFTTRSPQDLRAVAETLTKLFRERTILLLEGPVGAGKTELVKTLMQGWGIQETASPSFAIHHHYEQGEHEIDHVDLYRLQNEEDLDSTGFWDLFSARRGLVVIEWAERLNPDLLPLNWYKIKVVMQKRPAMNEREVTISLPG